MQAGDGFGETLGALQHLVEGFLQHLRVEELLAVLPLVDGLGLVEALVSLQADERQREEFRGGLGEFRLADAGRAFDQDGLAEVKGEINRRGDLVAANVAVILEADLEGFHRLGKLRDVCHSSSA